MGNAIKIRQLKIKPGQQLLLEDVSWQQFENILADLGEHRAAKISYSYGLLEIMVPLPEHEKAKEIIGDIVKILLNQKNINYDSLGSITLKNEKMTQGVEPDSCFYIQNQALVIGKNRLDLNIDPPPDLAIEIDLTSRTQLENYQILGVPELWRYGKKGLQINILQSGKYVESDFSPIFPDIPIIELVNQYVQQSRVIGSSQAIQAFSNWLRENKTIV
ncbi:Uma2 family endonuclease [Cronbergia sp. UHCC 0137]|uniref:Uma2 family endonuclease n=1 Tax=Cronbergia sp. UHCC 0137 TaxID=3110239 RepID=UPI002B1F33F3|nr:Uma2 family endonuclease [Cronbergia sp. UHCC 0137]MEA5619888.1 Uma2 family endonuclease [Cronbergia sp. UHCC 0137]